jgi:2,3-bisphosphoglycerate-independent phosphoglycerate mutase
MVRPLVLCILDGWGVAPHHDPSDATLHAPFFRQLCETNFYTTLDASEKAVGLPLGQMGNSEVGHTTIGLGHVMEQDLLRCSNLFNPKSPSFIEAQRAWEKFTQPTTHHSSPTVHLVGLFSAGGVHSHYDHWYGALKILAPFNGRVALHMISDGRDTQPKQFIHDLKQLVHDLCQSFPHAFIATVGGRFFAMDRDHRWERVEQAYRCIMGGSNGSSNQIIDDPIEYVKQCYEKGIYDEFIPPAVVRGYSGMAIEDIGWFMNFRKDRIVQLAHSFFEDGFNGFERQRPPQQGYWMAMKDFGSPINTWLHPLLPPPSIPPGLGRIISDHDLYQLRIAETEKYAHVTYFFNGGRQEPFPKEERVLIPSPKVATYDLAPEMSAIEITNHLEQALESKKYAFVVVNYANADMVGHTGSLEAAAKAVMVLDDCLKRLHEACGCHGYTLVITADHGNAERMHDASLHQPHTAHTCHEVPFVIAHCDKAIHPDPEHSKKGLDAIAPTVLSLMGLPIAFSMGAPCLFEVEG